MAVMDPIKLVIDNYPEGQVEYLDAPNNMENETLGTRKIPFSGELYIERDDFMIDPPDVYKRQAGDRQDNFGTNIILCYCISLVFSEFFQFRLLPRCV